MNEVLFFPEKVAACKDYFESAQGCLKEKCGFAHQMTGARFVVFPIIFVLFSIKTG